jgi:hypothetical protein
LRLSLCQLTQIKSLFAFPEKHERAKDIMDASQDFVQLKDKNSALKLKLGELEGAYQIALKEQRVEEEKGFQVCHEATLKEKEQDAKEIKKSCAQPLKSERMKSWSSAA